MARISKSKAFAIDEDDRVRTEEATEQSETEGRGDAGKVDEVEADDEVTRHEEDCGSISIIDHAPQEPVPDTETQDAEDADDERRESTITSTSISSFPDSYYMTENDDALNSYAAYTPPIIRTRFRRPESVRRMQMESPPPNGYRSPRQSILSHTRSRIGTPRSVRSGNARGSPKAKKQAAKEEEETDQHYPLVLLHVSLSPLNVPWNIENMQDILPSDVIENLQLLRSKLSETVLQRGVLIPHPREEYELLEERLLEALELQEERVTKCGHFCAQTSRISELSGSNTGQDSDSGIGSSADSSDEELCAICQSHIKQSKAGVGLRNRRWMIKVYAANGLMRSAAWAAAWSDMERVDVEMFPWINDDIRRKLDERSAQEEAAKHDLVEDEEIRIRRVVDEQVQLALAHKFATLLTVEQQQSSVRSEAHQHIIPESMRLEPPVSIPQSDDTQSIDLQDLPQIYRPSQIPISILLKNYFYLLAQDRRNLVILGLSIAVTFLVSVFSSRANQTRLEFNAKSLAKDIANASTIPQWTMIPSPSTLSWKEFDTATIETLPSKEAMRMDGTDVGLASYDSTLNSDLVESGADSSANIACAPTLFSNSSGVKHLSLDQILRRNHDMCAVEM